MGMFDTIRSSYDLGPGFTKELQTRDLSGLCECFWIDPQGRLFRIDYTGTQDWEKTPTEERTGHLDVYRSVPNGQRGRVCPYIMNGTIEVYPSKWTAYYAPFPRKLITFRDGILLVESDKSDSLIWKERYNSLKKWVKQHYET
ncbi:hypothetical protein [Cyanophage S-TIM5]|uniref:Uncharacterized protein n=1 Tax=Cyanophage S-TIM5 TaxID=1137745 RepID=H6WG79_9CAUD|nr:hypothetical protein F417_gp190 [Cyanophage S-TIM5]AEZ65624.1 hypothetical protein [Cyanophage S-TIM5]UYE97003.1 hypothetical protein [Cyanophage S-TIM61]